jgi:hypothetical protein
VYLKAEGDRELQSLATAIDNEFGRLSLVLFSTFSPLKRFGSTSEGNQHDIV